MARYGGTTLEAFAKQIEAEAPQGIRDWSVDVAFHLAMASIALQRLKEQGVQTTYKKRNLIKPALEDAWRQLIFIRQRYISEEHALNDVYRHVTLSGTGKVMINEDHENSYTHSRDQSDSGDTPKVRQKRYRRKNPLRFRRREFKERSSS